MNIFATIKRKFVSFLVSRAERKLAYIQTTLRSKVQNELDEYQSKLNEAYDAYQDKLSRKLISMEDKINERIKQLKAKL